MAEGEEKEGFSAIMAAWASAQPAAPALADCELEADLLGEVVPPRRGGRPAGARNKRTLALSDLIQATGQSPGMFLAGIMRDPVQAIRAAEAALKARGQLSTNVLEGAKFTAETIVRLQMSAADTLMPYVHQKLPVAVDLTADVKGMVLKIDLGAENIIPSAAGVGEAIEMTPPKALTKDEQNQMVIMPEAMQVEREQVNGKS